jgi:hypothetical protein
MDDDPRAPVADGPTRPDELSEPAFQALVGRWVTTPPAEVATLFAGAPFPWWVAGGWALELQGGRRREHLDTDVAFLLRDLPRLRRFLAPLHLWAPMPDRLRPVLPGTHLAPDEEQLWLRRDAAGPWLLDLLATPADGDTWVFKKDHRVRRPLDDVGRVGDGGVPVLAAAVVLLHKAGNDRERDRDDLRAMLPHLVASERSWLAEAVATAWPGHAWLDLV